MNTNRKYEFPQRKTKITHIVAEGIESLRGVGCSNDRILEIYLESQIKANPSSMIQSSALFTGRSSLLLRGKQTDDSKVLTYAQYDNTLTSVKESWNAIDPLAFLEQYDAYLHHEKNDSGLENGMISERLFSAVQKNMRLLIINPSPSFVRHIEGNTELRQLMITFAWENPRYVWAYRCYAWPPNIVCTDLESVDYQIPYTKICVMGAGMAYETMEKLLHKLCYTDTIHEKTLVFLLVPTAYIDRRKEKDAIRRTINEDCTVLQIVLIDSKSVNIQPTKRTMIVLRCRHHEKEIIPIQKAVFVKERGRYFIECGNAVNIKYSDFLRCTKTLNALFALTDEKNNICQRKQSEPFAFSREVTVFGSIRVVSNPKKNKPVYHPIFKFHNFPTADQLSRNKLERGECLVGGIYGGTAHTREAVYDCLEKTMFSNQQLAEQVRSAIAHAYTCRPVSLKTYWFWHYPVFSEREDYNHSLCQEIFLGRDWSTNPLCNLMVGESDADDVTKAMELFAKQHELSSKKIEMICEQLAILWNQYLRYNRTIHNPVNDVLEKIAKKRTAEYEMREALVVRSLTIKQMQSLLAHLNDSGIDSIMALIVKCKLFLGLGSGVIAALTLDDCYRIPGYDIRVLSITKVLPQTGIQPRQFIRPWQNILLPLTTDISKKLDELVQATKCELRRRGIPEKKHGEYPLFPSGDLREPIRTRRINEYCAGMLKELGLPEIVIVNPDDETESDIGQYHKDLFVANWKTQAALTAQMDRASICYLSGTRQKTVTNENYRDFTHPLEQRSLKLDLDRLQICIEQPFGPLNSQCVHTSLGGDRRKTIPFTPQARSTEIVIELQIEGNDSVELELNALHGCFVSVEYLLEEEK